DATQHTVAEPDNHEDAQLNTKTGDYKASTSKGCSDHTGSTWAITLYKMTQNCSRDAKEKNCQTKGDGYITFCPAKGIFKRKIKYAPGIDGADTEMNPYGRCSYKATVFHNCLPRTMIGPSFARRLFACALSWVAGCASRNNSTMAIYIRTSEKS